ncbi:DUF4148 domain-containing protein [Burkholderia sp. 22PA0099]|uniref:DUF4148 domain-containing protein n=1 Tax=Burkholderia sp. 22PA0099 TaxID=3237372 RepID=UPI0039C008F9
MNKTIRGIAALATAGMASLALAAPAMAKVDNNGLTRAQVHAQLVDAQRDGLVPARDGDYPPSAQSIERSRELYAISHHAAYSESGARAAASE